VCARVFFDFRRHDDVPFMRQQLSGGQTSSPQARNIENMESYAVTPHSANVQNRRWPKFFVGGRYLSCWSHPLLVTFDL